MQKHTAISSVKIKRCLVGLSLLIGSSVHAASITFNAPVTMSSDTDVSTTGTAVFAYNWNSSLQTINGVDFTAPDSGVATASFYGVYTGFGDSITPSGTLSAAYKSILTAGLYTDTARPATVTLNNLVVDRQYEVQLWVDDSRSLGGALRSETVTSAGGNTVTLNFPANSEGALGQYTIGTFTADSTSQLITLDGNVSSQINAIQLRDLSLPITAAPVLNPPPETYFGAQQVTLTSEPGSTVFYTTNGTPPSADSANGGAGSGSASVNLPALSTVTIRSYATHSGQDDSPEISGVYATVTHIAPTIIFTGPHRQGVNKDGVVEAEWGIEQTMLYEDGLFKSWYHGAPDSNGNYWDNPVVRYATSPDGVTWTDQGVCVGNDPYFRACPFVYHLMSDTAAGEPAGYYMPVGRNGQFGFDLFYSTDGLPGTWVQLNDGNLILGLGPDGSWDEFRTGNISIWYESDQWQVMYEAADEPPAYNGHGSQWFSWRTGRAYGPSLTHLTKHVGNPVLSNTSFPYGEENVAGGPEVHKVGDTYYSVIHETDPVSRHSLTPSSCSLYKSTDLNNWTRMGWLARIWVNKSKDSQVADGSLLSVNGKTYFWYEDQPDQSTLLPSLSLMTWDMPFEELVNHPEMLDDTAVDGWIFEPGYGEVPSSDGAFPTTYFRKLSAPISPNCVVLAADASHELKIRKPIGLTDNTFIFTARAEQINKKFVPLRLDADGNDTVLAGAYFDVDGLIKYYSGTTLVTAQPYVADTNYDFVYQCSPTGYSLTINGTLIASDIPYASPYTTPAYYKMEQSSGSTGYVGTTAPKFTSITHSENNDIQLDGIGSAGQPYVVMATTNLVTSIWAPMATNMTMTHGILQFTDVQATNYDQRFYHLELP